MMETHDGKDQQYYESQEEAELECVLHQLYLLEVCMFGQWQPLSSGAVEESSQKEERGCGCYDIPERQPETYPNRSPLYYRLKI